MTQLPPRWWVQWAYFSVQMRRWDSWTEQKTKALLSKLWKCVHSVASLLVIGPAQAWFSASLTDQSHKHKSLTPWCWLIPVHFLDIYLSQSCWFRRTTSGHELFPTALFQGQSFLLIMDHSWTSHTDSYSQLSSALVGHLVTEQVSLLWLFTVLVFPCTRHCVRDVTWSPRFSEGTSGSATCRAVSTGKFLFGKRNVTFKVMVCMKSQVQDNVNLGFLKNLGRVFMQIYTNIHSQGVGFINMCRVMNEKWWDITACA